MLPKHVKPAFFVLAPAGRKPDSRTPIFNEGCFNFRYSEALKPTIPLPMIITSKPDKNDFCSQ
jgi:hypothetical protein